MDAKPETEREILKQQVRLYTARNIDEVAPRLNTSKCLSWDVYYSQMTAERQTGIDIAKKKKTVTEMHLVLYTILGDGETERKGKRKGINKDAGTRTTAFPA